MMILAPRGSGSFHVLKELSCCRQGDNARAKLLMARKDIPQPTLPMRNLRAPKRHAWPTSRRSASKAYRLQALAPWAVLLLVFVCHGAAWVEELGTSSNLQSDAPPLSTKYEAGRVRRLFQEM